jgi:hypothetical protein
MLKAHGETWTMENLNMLMAKQAAVRNSSSGAIRTLTAAEIEAVAGGETPPAGDGTTGPYNPNPRPNPLQNIWCVTHMENPTMVMAKQVAAEIAGAKKTMRELTVAQTAVVSGGLPGGVIITRGGQILLPLPDPSPPSATIL